MCIESEKLSVSFDKSRIYFLSFFFNFLLPDITSIIFYSNTINYGFIRDVLLKLEESGCPALLVSLLRYYLKGVKCHQTLISMHSQLQHLHGYQFGLVAAGEVTLVSTEYIRYWLLCAPCGEAHRVVCALYDAS